MTLKKKTPLLGEIKVSSPNEKEHYAKSQGGSAGWLEGSKGGEGYHTTL